ncbi:MAG: zinc-dependent metalloprotease [Bacteroidota bacterium]
MNKTLLTMLGIFALALTGQPAFAQAGNDAGDKKEEKSDKGKKNKEKTYEDIITEEAITDEGLFTVHQVKEKYYFEIPTTLLEKEILLVSRIRGHVKGLNFGGAGMKSRPQQVVRWQLKGKKVYLRSVSYNAVADENLPIYNSVRNNNFEPVVASFSLSCFNTDSTAIVFDPSSFFTTDVAMIGPMSERQRKNFGVKSLDSKRSFIENMQSFPKNTEVRHVLTFKGGDKLPDNRVTGTLSIGMNQSFIMLPEETMRPREYDSRVGYFSIRQTDYGLDEQKAAQRRYITRWKLEPKDVAAYKRGELVEPVKPIVYYIDPATPEEWRPYIKQGVDDWQKSFEAAGFKNAIMAKDPPTKEENPDWSPEDVRYSVIRYVATEIQNAQGPHVHDPRTGEILESDIIWYHNVMNLLRNWFFIQTAAVNPDAQNVKFKTEIMGELIRFVAAHEVGHTLGLPHNMGASPAYPVDSLRAPGFVQRMGVAPSIMDYARFNYVKQPEDKGAGVMPVVGPYDDWSIEWGYTYFPDANSVEEEEKILNEKIIEKADNPYFRFGQQQRTVLDPSAQTEDVGDDPVKASMLGVANLKRIMDNLIEWTSEDGKDYSDLRELHRNVVSQLRRYTGHVANNVGGVYEYDKTSDEEGAVYMHVPKERQAAAVEFVNTLIFQTPTWLIDKEIQSRIGSTGAHAQINGLQNYALRVLFNGDRINRMIENETLNGSMAYAPSRLFLETRQAVFSEIDHKKSIDPYRRNLQRAYIQQMGSLVMTTGSKYEQSDIKTLASATLESIEHTIKHARKRMPDNVSKKHLEDLLIRIEAIEKGRLTGENGAARPNALKQDRMKGCFEE